MNEVIATPELIAKPRKKITGFLRESGASFIHGVKAVTPRQWLKVTLSVVGMVAVMAGFTLVSQSILDRVNLSLNGYANTGYLTVFFVFLVTNLSLFIPLPIALTVLITVGAIHNPVVTGLAAALGSSIGEMSGYLAGRMGRKIFIRENFMCSITSKLCNTELTHQVQHYGALSITILAVQPVLPFDIAGIVAGSVKMNALLFFGAVAAGKGFKYIAIAYASGIIGHLMPFYIIK